MFTIEGDYLGISYMSILEIDVGIICACMPTMQLLLRRAGPRLFGSTVHADSYLHPYTSSRSRTYRSTNSHHRQSKSGITNTTTTTVNDMPKDSDSTIELVDGLGRIVQRGYICHSLDETAPVVRLWTDWSCTAPSISS